MTTAVSTIISLVDQIYSYLIALQDGRLDTFLGNWPSPPYPIRTISPSSLPVLAYLPQLDDNEDTKAIIKTLQALASQLYWGQSYTTADFGAAFLEKYGWTEIIGQRGPIASEQLACGFLLLGPQLEYPLHSHEAEEIYVPFTASSQWARGNEAWVKRPVSQPIFHSAWLPHAMRSGTRPLLALYLWHNGDLTQKSRIL